MIFFIGAQTYSTIDAFLAYMFSYRCEVWGFHTALFIERVHLNLCKLVLKVSKSTCNEVIYGELEIYNLVLDEKDIMLSYWWKFLMRKQVYLYRKFFH